MRSLVVLVVLAGIVTCSKTGLTPDEAVSPTCMDGVRKRLLEAAPTSAEAQRYIKEQASLMGLDKWDEFRDLHKAPVDFKKLLGRIQTCAAQNTYLTKFVCSSANAKWFDVPRDLLRKAVIHTPFLERATRTLIKKPHLIAKAVAHFKKLRKKTQCLKNSRLFSKAKMWAVDLALGANAKAVDSDADVSRSGGWRIGLNIYEAVVMDLVAGHKANAHAGHILATNLAGAKKKNPATGEGPSKILRDPKRVALNFPLGAKWADLYQMWNLAFVYSYKDSYPLWFTKLLIPSVVCYHKEPSTFLWARGIALFLQINWACAWNQINKADSKIWSKIFKPKSAMNSFGRFADKCAKDYRKDLDKVKPPSRLSIRRAKATWRSMADKAKVEIARLKAAKNVKAAAVPKLEDTKVRMGQLTQSFSSRVSKIFNRQQENTEE